MTARCHIIAMILYYIITFHNTLNCWVRPDKSKNKMIFLCSIKINKIWWDKIKTHKIYVFPFFYLINFVLKWNMGLNFKYLKISIKMGKLNRNDKKTYCKILLFGQSFLLRKSGFKCIQDKIRSLSTWGRKIVWNMKMFAYLLE